MTADTIGGVWNYAVALGEALPDTEFVIATFGPKPTRGQLGRIGALDNVIVETSRFGLEWMQGSDLDVEPSCQWLRGLAERIGPDLLHVNGYAHALCAWRLPVLVVAHSCVLSWWRAVHGTDAPAEWRQYGHRVSAALLRADAVVAPTRAYLEQMCGVYGDLRNARVIYNALDSGNAHAREHECRMPFALAAGRLWDAAKNLPTLDIAAEGLRWPVYVAGPATEPGAARESSTRNLRALGAVHRDELRAWMQRASIFVSPALYEPFGLTILEAACAGCALVLGDIPTLRELWTGAAVFVAPTDAAGLHRALDELIGDPAKLRKYRTAAVRRARQFSQQQTALAYAELYAGLVARWRAASVRSGEPIRSRVPVHV